jgi:predicted nucleotidyltransferase component of viral defense system
MHYEVLDEERKSLLPSLAAFKDRFYLAGGTGLALQIGHRVSVDFDLFTEAGFDTEKLLQELNAVFDGQGRVVSTLAERDSLGVTVDGSVKMSFLRYPYPLLQPCVEDEYFRIASIEDIGCMKLSAIVSRATEKDFVDVHFILKQVSLEKLLDAAAKKMPVLDRNLALKSLVYFDDVEEGGVVFRPGFETPFSEVKAALEREVRRAAGVG